MLFAVRHARHHHHHRHTSGPAMLRALTTN
jgi:hypothetical protein